MERVFSGIQPSGNIHIGNYSGAIRHWAANQTAHENIFCVVDYHAITTYQDPKTIKTKTNEVAGLLLAAGISPEQSILFVQSQVSAHTELAWILNCVTPMGWMNRMTQYKDKAKNKKESVSVGLFDYPALMAADILLYQTDFVPVGDDQKQHVELTRDIAQRFNNIYGETFKIPAPSIARIGARIMGLDDATKKMSKSDPNAAHAIHLLDTSDAIRSKIKRARTDSSTEIRFDESRPEVYNLLVIYELVTGLGRSEIETQFDGKGYAVFKDALADAVIAFLEPLQSRYTALQEDPAQLERLLNEGAAKARLIAEHTLRQVKARIGLR